MGLNNYEALTHELTDDEKKLLPLVVNGLKTKIGKSKAIKNKEMLAGLQQWTGRKVSEPRLRKIIQYIRLNGIIERLIATPKGYWISNDIEEIEAYQETALQRINQFQQGYDQMKFQLEKFKSEQP